MTRTLTDEYFKNKREQSKIKLALWDAMPLNVYYFNVIIALTEMLTRVTAEAFRGEVMHKKPIDTTEAAE